MINSIVALWLACAFVPIEGRQLIVPIARNVFNDNKSGYLSFYVADSPIKLRSTQGSNLNSITLSAIYKDAKVLAEIMSHEPTNLVSDSTSRSDTGISLESLLSSDAPLRFLADSEIDSTEFRSCASKLQFDLCGMLIRNNVPVVSLSTQRGEIAYFRGFWKPIYSKERNISVDRICALVFFGRGVRVRYKISGFRFFNSDRFSRYTVRTDIYNPQSLGFQKSDIIVEEFGSDKNFSLMAGIRTTSRTKAFTLLTCAVSKHYASTFSDNGKVVEPILIVLRGKGAEYYIHSPQSPFVPK